MLNKLTFLKSRLAIAMMGVFSSLAAFAEDVERVGIPIQDGMWFQPAIGDQARTAQALNIWLVYLSIVISIFVCVLLAIVIFRFRDTGKEPKRFSHNTPLEIAWTLGPVLILVFIAFFSVPALKAQVSTPKGDVVIKATGYQWFWGYEYPEEGVSFDSIMLQKEELAENGFNENEYLLAVDNPVVVPVNKTIVVQTTGADVIHAWKVPAFYVMADATPGRTQQQWFKADKEGIYYGQCSELCGKDHAYMPIMVKVVSEEEYAKWLAVQKGEANASAVQVAAAE